MLKGTENELFSKTVFVRDGTESKAEELIDDLVDKKAKASMVVKQSMARAESELIPVLQNSESMGRLLQKNMLDL